MRARTVAHEAGHRWAAARRGVQLGAPILVPAWLGFLGSFGAITFIRRVPDRRAPAALVRSHAGSRRALAAAAGAGGAALLGPGAAESVKVVWPSGRVFKVGHVFKHIRNVQFMAARLRVKRRGCGREALLEVASAGPAAGAAVSLVAVVAGLALSAAGSGGVQFEPGAFDDSLLVGVLGAPARGAQGGTTP